MTRAVSRYLDSGRRVLCVPLSALLLLETCCTSFSRTWSLVFSCEVIIEVYVCSFTCLGVGAGSTFLDGSRFIWWSILGQKWDLCLEYCSHGDRGLTTGYGRLSVSNVGA